MSKTQMNLQKLKKRAQGLHRSAQGPLSLFYILQFSVFIGLLSI